MCTTSLKLSVAFPLALPPPSLALIANPPKIPTIVLDIGMIRALPVSVKPIPFTVPLPENVTPVDCPQPFKEILGTVLVILSNSI